MSNTNFSRFESFLLTRHSYLLSCWYPRAQISLRISMFYTISQSFAGMSAILSYGVSIDSSRVPDVE